MVPCQSPSGRARRSVDGTELHLARLFCPPEFDRGGVPKGLGSDAPSYLPIHAAPRRDKYR
jgi:hypothetical protein